MQPGKPGNRGIRGIRKPLLGGMVVGRKVQGGSGAAELLSIYDIMQILRSQGAFQNALPKNVNQFVHVTVAAADEVMLLSGVVGDILQFNLSEGTWDVSASVTFDPTHGSYTSFSNAIAAISTGSGVLPPPPNGGGYVGVMTPLDTTGITTLTTAVMRINVAVPVQPFWLVAKAVFS